jgi:hypothetical protein
MDRSGTDLLLKTLQGYRTRLKKVPGLRKRQLIQRG